MIELLGLFLIFVAGLFIGSFLNVVAHRIPAGQSPLRGRSKCDHCSTQLEAKDLVPLLSYIWLKAKCRYCDKKISKAYPISEIATGLILVGIASFLGVFGTPNLFLWVNFAYLAIVASFMIIIFIADLEYKLIPNKIVIPAIIFVLLFLIGMHAFIAYSSYQQMAADPFGQYLLEVGYWKDQMLALARSLSYTILSALAIGVFFWLLIIVTRGKGMGGGDVKLAFLIGLVNGFPVNIVAIILGFISGALYSGVLILLKRKGMKDVIPFGPFLIFGSFVAFVFGQLLFNWYINLI